MTSKTPVEIQLSIVKEYNNLSKTTFLSKKYNFSKSKILDILKKYKVKIRNKHSERRTNFFDLDYFEDINTEDKAYFLGLMYADGFILANGLNSVLSLQEDDIDILENFKKYTNFTGKIQYIKRPLPRKNMYRIVFSSKQFTSDLIKNGCYNKKSLTLKFPTIEQVPDHLINHFIRGYFDGDGCLCYSNNNQIITFVSSKDFCFKLKEILNKKLGFEFGSINRKNNAKNTYTLYISGNIIVPHLLHYIYDNSYIFLKRKYNKAKNFLDLPLRKPYSKN